MSASLEYIMYSLAFKLNMSREEVRNLDFEVFLDLMLTDVLDQEREYVENQMSMILAVNSVIEMMYTGKSGYVDQLVDYIEGLEEDSKHKSEGCSLEEMEMIREHLES